jgi:hypothetical protein
MRWLQQDKEPERYYLLPGMGGQALHRKRMLMLWWSLAVGLFISTALALVIYWLNTPPN